MANCPATYWYQSFLLLFDVQPAFPDLPRHDAITSDGWNHCFYYNSHPIQYLPVMAGSTEAMEHLPWCYCNSISI